MEQKSSYLTAIVFLGGKEKKVLKYRNIKNSEKHINFFLRFLQRRFEVKSINFYDKETRQFIKQTYIEKEATGN